MKDGEKDGELLEWGTRQKIEPGARANGGTEWTGTETDLFGIDIPYKHFAPPGPASPMSSRKSKTRPKGYARPPGTGPTGETCQTCAHYRRVQGGSNAYLKCALIQHRWTRGPGTDIRAKSPACELWKRP